MKNIFVEWLISESVEKSIICYNVQLRRLKDTDQTV